MSAHRPLEADNPAVGQLTSLPAACSALTAPMWANMKTVLANQLTIVSYLYLLSILLYLIAVRCRGNIFSVSIYI
jgi:hypothetical protein